MFFSFGFCWHFCWFFTIFSPVDSPVHDACRSETSHGSSENSWISYCTLAVRIIPVSDHSSWLNNQDNSYKDTYIPKKSVAMGLWSSWYWLLWPTFFSWWFLKGQRYETRDKGCHRISGGIKPQNASHMWLWSLHDLKDLTIQTSIFYSCAWLLRFRARQNDALCYHGSGNCLRSWKMTFQKANLKSCQWKSWHCRHGSISTRLLHMILQARRGYAFSCSILNEVLQNCHSAPKQTILHDLPYKILNSSNEDEDIGYLQLQKYCKDWISSTSIYNLKVLLDLALFDLHCYTVSWQLWQPSDPTGGFSLIRLLPSSSGKAIGEVAIVLTSHETDVFGPISPPGRSAAVLVQTGGLFLYIKLKKKSLFPRKKGNFKRICWSVTRKCNQHMSLPHAKCVFPIENQWLAPSSIALCLFASFFRVIVHNLNWDNYTSTKLVGGFNPSEKY